MDLLHMPHPLFWVSYFKGRGGIKKSWSALIVPSTTLLVLLTVNMFFNKVVPNVPNNMPRNLPFYSFAAFLIVSLTPFFNKPDSLSDLTIFMITFICSFEITTVVVPDPNIFLWIAASAAAAAAVKPNFYRNASS